MIARLLKIRWERGPGPAANEVRWRDTALSSVACSSPVRRWQFRGIETRKRSSRAFRTNGPAGSGAWATAIRTLGAAIVGPLRIMPTEWAP